VIATGRECPDSASAADLQAMLSAPPNNVEDPCPNGVPLASAAPMLDVDSQVAATPARRARSIPMSSPANLDPDSSPLNPFTSVRAVII
jgi:hypothetical protein